MNKSKLLFVLINTHMRKHVAKRTTSFAVSLFNENLTIYLYLLCMFYYKIPELLLYILE